MATVCLPADRRLKEVYSKAQVEDMEMPFVELVTNREPVPSTGGWLHELNSVLN
jgi:hypothetical protein